MIDGLNTWIVFRSVALTGWSAGNFWQAAIRDPAVRIGLTRNCERFLEHGIRHVISLMEPDEKDWRGKSFMSYEAQMRSIAKSMGRTVNFDTMPIKDTRVPSRLEMCRILDLIDQTIEDQRPVYVHCQGGRGRTGTVVGCYLARHGMATGQDVLNRIKELRRNTEDHWIASPETLEQVDMVLSWVEAE